MRELGMLRAALETSDDCISSSRFQLATMSNNGDVLTIIEDGGRFGSQGVVRGVVVWANRVYIKGARGV